MKSRWSCSFMLLILLFLAFAPSVFADVSNIQPKQMNAETLFVEKKEFVDRELIVKFMPNTSTTERETLLNQVKGIEVSKLDDGDFSVIKVQSSSDLPVVAKSLIKSKHVLLVEPNYKFKKNYIPQDPGYKQQWYLNKLNLPKAWDQTKGSAAITVAVIDDGVQQNHPDLKGKIVSPFNAVTGKTAYIPGEHATHVAGIIAANFNKIGIAGIAPNVKIMPINVFQNDEASAGSVARAIQYAIDHHADIINMSFGNERNSYLIDSYTRKAKSKGIVLVAAAGNSASFFPMYPAACSAVLGVSATDKWDKIASFSNRGNYIDLAAPGVDIYSTVTGSSYDSFNGTSMAAPIVSGVAALVRSKNPLLSPDQVESILEKSTVDLGAKGRDDYYGYGRIDAAKAVSNTPLPISKMSVPKTYTMTGKNKVALSFQALSKTNVSLTIKSDGGKAIRKIITNKASTGAKISIVWDGKNSSKKYVATGSYKVEVKVTKGKKAFFKSTTMKVINHTKPDILVSGTYSYSPKVMKNMSIPYEITQNGKLTAVITNQAGKTIRKVISSRTLPAGKYAIVWDGKNSNGQLVKDTTYDLTMSFTNSQTKGITKKVQIKVDTTPPSATMKLSSTLFKANGRNNYSATITLNESTNLVVEIRNEKGTKIKKLTNTAAKAGTITLNWNGKNDKNELVPEGKYLYRVQLKDTAGNQIALSSATFSLQDWRIPSIQATKDVYFKTKGIITINYELNKPGTVSIGVFQGKDTLKTITTDRSEAAGKHSFQWDGKDAANLQVPDGDYQFVIKAVDNYQQVQSFTGTIHDELTKITISNPSVVVLYPSGAIRSEVYYQLSQPANVTIELFNSANKKVKTIQQNEAVKQGIQSFRWDGKNDLGQTENGTTYFYMITAENEYGTIVSVKGKMTDTDDPSWLVSHHTSFHDSPNNAFYHDKMIWDSQLSQPTTAELYVYNYDGGILLDKKKYSLNSGKNKITYTKPTTAFLFYLLVYRDPLGNQYWYQVDEWEY